MMQYKMVLDLFQKLHPLIRGSQFLHDIIDYPTFIILLNLGSAERNRKNYNLNISRKKKTFTQMFFIAFEGLSLVKK